MKDKRHLRLVKDNVIFVPRFIDAMFTIKPFFIDKCSKCSNTGSVWVEYGQCEDKDCTAHKGWEDCPSCNIRPIDRKGRTK